MRGGWREWSWPARQTAAARLVTTAALIALAWLVHRFVEQPSQNWLRAALARESSNPPTLPHS
ncbi:hypothetical protein [Streptomyces sp. NPDC048473]|uniref:hypothetical protein n=1 Tax=unclassified Streptomyces TaxID=2593676 RepID=UPI0037121445